ncbi:natural resistance-associated macrophage protein-domain-containing protein, partial [Apiospora arundinis]
GANNPENGRLALSSSEKRRNKLGYHRTSVACDHCRRRKIRCTLQPADPGRRCMSCIRLKKGCSFCPVDQQPATLRRQKQGTRSSVRSKIQSAPSSPTMATGQPPGAPWHQMYTQLSTTQSLQHMGPSTMPHASADTYSITPEGGLKAILKSTNVLGSAPGTRGYDFGLGVNDWIATNAGNSSSTKNTDDINASWWAYPLAPSVTPACSSPMLHALPTSTTWSAAPGSAAMTAGIIGEVVSRAEDVPWNSCVTATTRSMSCSGGDDPHENYSPLAGHADSNSHRPRGGSLRSVVLAGAGQPPSYGVRSPPSHSGLRTQD